MKPREGERGSALYLLAFQFLARAFGQREVFAVAVIYPVVATDEHKVILRAL